MTQSIYKGTMVPDNVYKEFDFNITIPEEYLPFLRFEKTIKEVPNTKIVSLLPYEQSRWIDIPYIRVKGDSTTIYEGPGGPSVYSKYRYVTRKYVHSQEDLDAGYFPSAHTKKVYNAIVEYTQGGELYKIEGQVQDTTIVDNVSTGCNGNNNRNVYELAYDPDNPNFYNYTYPISLTDTGISAHFKKTEIVWEDRGSGCLQYDTVTEGTTTSKSWGAVYTNQNYTGARKYKWDGSNWIFQQLGNFAVSEYPGGSSVFTSQLYSFAGYWVYYSTDFRWLFGIADGDFDGHIDDLVDVPNISGLQQPYYLPYTVLTLEQNFGDHPLDVDTLKSVYSEATYERPDTFTKIGEKNGIPIWNIKSVVSCDIETPAIVVNPNSPTFDVYNNRWTKVTDIVWPKGYTYAKTTTSQTKKTKITYISEQKDNLVKLRVILLNPVFSKEDQRYLNE